MRSGHVNGVLLNVHYQNAKMAKMPLDTMGDTFALAGLLCGCDKSASCGEGRRHDNCLPAILMGFNGSKLFWMVGETTSDAHVRGGPPYPSHKVYPAYQVQLLSQPPKSIFRTTHTSYFLTHTLLNQCLVLSIFANVTFVHKLCWGI